MFQTLALSKHIAKETIGEQQNNFNERNTET